MKANSLKTRYVARNEVDSLTQLIRLYMPKLPSLVIKGLGYRMAGSLYTPKPARLGLKVTNRCNARCIMCPGWRMDDGGKELTVSEIREVVSNPLFDSLERFSFGGGEPTIREDLAEIAEVVLDARPGIKRFGISTNGLQPSRVRQQVMSLADITHKRSVEFSVAVSIDGYRDTHDRIRRVPHAFDKVNETILLLKELRMQLPFNMHLNTVVQQLNISELPQLYEFARELELKIQFIPAIAALLAENDDDRQKLELNPLQIEEMKLFLNNPQHTMLPVWAAFWQEYFRVIQGGRRRFPCALLYHSVHLHSDGNLFICGVHEPMILGNIHDAPADEIWYSDEAKRIRERVKENYCPNCVNSCDIPFSLGEEFFYFARFLMKEEFKKLLRRFQQVHL